MCIQKSGERPLSSVKNLSSKMKLTVIIIDVSIDREAALPLIRSYQPGKPTFIKHEVIHYCVPNIASESPELLPMAVSNILTLFC